MLSDAPQSQAIDVDGCCKIFTRSGSAQNRARHPARENPCDGLAAGWRALFFLHGLELLLRFWQIHAGRSTKARRERGIDVGDDARTLRRIGQLCAKRIESAILRPRWHEQCRKGRLSGEIRIGVSGRVMPRLRRRSHGAENRGRRSLLTSLHLHVRDDGNQSRAVADLECFRDTRLR